MPTDELADIPALTIFELSRQKYLTSVEKAKELGVSTRTLANWTNEGKVRPVAYLDTPGRPWLWEAGK